MKSIIPRKLRLSERDGSHHRNGGVHHAVDVAQPSRHEAGGNNNVACGLPDTAPSDDARPVDWLPDLGRIDMGCYQDLLAGGVHHRLHVVPIVAGAPAAHLGQHESDEVPAVALAAEEHGYGVPDEATFPRLQVATALMPDTVRNRNSVCFCVLGRGAQERVGSLCLTRGQRAWVALAGSRGLALAVAVLAPSMPTTGRTAAAPAALIRKPRRAGSNPGSVVASRTSWAMRSERRSPTIRTRLAVPDSGPLTQGWGASRLQPCPRASGAGAQASGDRCPAKVATQRPLPCDRS